MRADGPQNGPFLPEHGFDIRSTLGYRYDNLPRKDAQFLKVLPTFAVFEKAGPSRELAPNHS